MTNARTIASMRKILSDAVEMSGSQSAWCRRHGFPQSVVSEALSGRREVPESIINALGYVIVPAQCIPMKGQNHV